MEYMKHLFCLVFILAVLVSDSVVAHTVQTQDDEWQLVFSDEFNQKNGSQPDTARWVCCTRYHSVWNRWISRSKDVAYIKNGKLVCRAIPNRTEPGDTAKMLTAAIETRGKYSFQYGKVEVRMKTNKTRGNFPAVWMRPARIDPDRYGEIDIVEMYGDQGKAHQTVHTHLTTILKKGKPFTVGNQLSVNKWHVYGLEWSPDRLTMTIDGRVTGVFHKSPDAQELSDGQWTFDRPFCLLLNQSVGNGGAECLIPDTDHVYETQFDWIRVYQKKQ